MIDPKKTVEELLKKACEANTSIEALEFSKTACNCAHALSSLKELERVQ